MNGSGITYEDVILAQSREEKEQLKKKLEAYKNMRKEAIEWINNYLKIIEEPQRSVVLTDDVVIGCLLNILNKVGEDNE